MNRRRFLAISAAALALPARAEPIRWTGRALGAEATLTLHAPAAQAQAAIAAVQAELTHIEALFSLYGPASHLSRLNAEGRLPDPHSDLLDLLRHADTAHRWTGGAFDPTVQPLWQALATGGNTHAAKRLIGWDRVRISEHEITLSPGQALTLNGIAQGYATDRIAARLRTLKMHRVLVNIGEYAAVGGPWRLGIADPAQGLIATRTLHDRAIATSSAHATLVGGHSHLLGPHAPLWSTVSVEANNATLADALSTGFSLMNEATIRATLAQLPEQVSVLLADEHGERRMI